MQVESGMAIPMATEQQVRALEKARRFASPATEVMYDGEKGYALVISKKSPGGLDLVAPMVIAIPLGDWLLFASQVTQILAAQLRVVPLNAPKNETPST